MEKKAFAASAVRRTRSNFVSAVKVQTAKFGDVRSNFLAEAANVLQFSGISTPTNSPVLPPAKTFMPANSFPVHFRATCRFLRLLIVFVGVAVASLGARPKWDPVSPADLAARDSTAAPGADSEILFSRHTLLGDVTEDYVRAKVYTQHGVEKLSVLSIDHGWNGEISRLAARVLKANGTAIDLTKNDFHETIRWKHGDSTSKRTSFAFPNVEAGDIVEYRWEQEVPHWLYSYHRIFCQAEDVFTREFLFEIKDAELDFNVMWANCPQADYDPKARRVLIRNLPPFIPEPHMPAEAEYRGTVTVMFSHPLMRIYGDGAEWPTIGGAFARIFNNDIKSKKAVRAKAAELTAKSTDPKESVARIYRFVQTEIKNLSFDNSPALAAAKKKRDRAEAAQSPVQTLELRTGNAWDINLLFAALVHDAGFDVRIGASADREQVVDIATPKGWVMADRRTIVVNYGEHFGFYTPGNAFVPCEMLDSKDEGAMVYICGEQTCEWGRMPVTEPAATQIHRTGRFTLDSEGTLDGDVEIQLTGHRAMAARDAYRDKSNDEMLKNLREELAQRLTTAEASDLQWANLTDTTKPFVLQYKIHMPGYAEIAGSRLILPMNFFTANAPVVFASETRHYPIFLGYAEQDFDDVTLALPKDYEPDGASAPSWVADASSVIYAKYSASYLRKSHALTYHREYVAGNGGVTLKAESYPILRKLYEHVHRSDLHQLVLQAKEAGHPAPVEPKTAVPVSK